MTDPFQDLTAQLVDFRDARDWRQFHSIRNLALSVSIEAAEILEEFQWLSDAEAESKLGDPEFRHRLGEEVADVFLYLLMVCERAGIDLEDAARRKIERNRAKYPVEKSRGSSRKYTEL